MGNVSGDDATAEIAVAGVRVRIIAWRLGEISSRFWKVELERIQSTNHHSINKRGNKCTYQSKSN
jgi:hypothetical protein